MRARVGGLSPRILPVGEAALSFEFGDAVDPEISRLVLAADQAVSRAAIDGVTETVPTYRSLLVEYEPEIIEPDELIRRILDLPLQMSLGQQQGRSWTVPVCYGGLFGDDLEDVAARTGLAPNSVIDLQSSACYQIYMIGFAPGLAYLGGVPPQLHLPRRQSPRGQVPEGTLIIGGMQAAIVSIPVPTGWYALGRTPWRCFDPARPDAFLFRSGDRMTFRPIDAEAFAAIERGIADGHEPQPDAV